MIPQLLAMGVVDAEGLDDDPVGEENTHGNGRQGTFHNDIKERDGGGCENDDADSFHPDLEPCGVRMSAM